MADTPLDKLGRAIARQATFQDAMRATAAEVAAARDAEAESTPPVEQDEG